MVDPDNHLLPYFGQRLSMSKANTKKKEKRKMSFFIVPNIDGYRLSALNVFLFFLFRACNWGAASCIPIHSHTHIYIGRKDNPWFFHFFPSDLPNRFALFLVVFGMSRALYRMLMDKMYLWQVPMFPASLYFWLSHTLLSAQGLSRQRPNGSMNRNAKKKIEFEVIEARSEAKI